MDQTGSGGSRAFRGDVKVSVCAELTRGAMTEFQEKLRQQHEESMHRELEALVTTAGPAEAEVRRHGGDGRRVSQSWAFVAFIEQIFVERCTQRVRCGEFRSAGGTGGQRPPPPGRPGHTLAVLSPADD